MLNSLYLSRALSQGHNYHWQNRCMLSLCARIQSGPTVCHAKRAIHDAYTCQDKMMSYCIMANGDLYLAWENDLIYYSKGDLYLAWENDLIYYGKGDLYLSQQNDLIYYGKGDLYLSGGNGLIYYGKGDLYLSWENGLIYYGKGDLYLSCGNGLIYYGKGDLYCVKAKWSDDVLSQKGLVLYHGKMVTCYI